MATFNFTPSSGLQPAFSGNARFGNVELRVGYGFTYRQRAYNTTLGQYVFWTSYGFPDTTGINSGYPVANLTSITVLSRSA